MLHDKHATSKHYTQTLIFNEVLNDYVPVSKEELEETITQAIEYTDQIFQFVHNKTLYTKIINTDPWR